MFCLYERADLIYWESEEFQISYTSSRWLSKGYIISEYAQLSLLVHLCICFSYICAADKSELN